MRVYRRPGSPHWQIELSTPTGKKRFSARTTVKKEAVRLATYKQQQVNDARDYDKNMCITLAEACDLYLEEQFSKSEATYLNAKFNVKHILDGAVWAPNTPFESLTSKQLLRLQKLKAHLSNNSVNHLTTALVTMKNRAEVWEVQAPSFKVKKLKAVQKFRYLRDGEEELLLATCKEQDIKDLIIFLVDTGMRISEAVATMWADINDIGVVVFRRKTGNRTLLPITPRLREILKRRQADSLSAYVFPHNTVAGAHRTPATKGIRLAAARAGLNAPEIVERFGKFTAHSLRDTYATRLVKAGLSLYQVQTMLGHASPQQTQKYAHLTTTDICDQVLAALS